MNSLGKALRGDNAKRVIPAIVVLAVIISAGVLIQLNATSKHSDVPTSNPAIVTVGGNPSWDIVGSMILYRNNSKAGNQSYWVAQSFHLIKPNASSIIVRIDIYIWLARDVPPTQSFPGPVDNITALLLRNDTSGNPNLGNPVANRTIGPGNISAVGPYPKGVMKINNTLAVHLVFTTTDPLLFNTRDSYFIFLYRQNIGDNDDYHIGYAYYWGASKLDLYYGGGSWLLNSTKQWTYYPNDMCFMLFEGTI